MIDRKLLEQLLNDVPTEDIQKFVDEHIIPPKEDDPPDCDECSHSYYAGDVQCCDRETEGCELWYEEY